MASVREIAKRAGVSVATVSRALNNAPYVDAETRRRVLEAAQQAGYGQDPSGRVGTVIGLVYPEAVVPADYGGFESALLVGMLDGLGQTRYDLKILDLARDRDPVESFAAFFRRKGLRGVILRSFEQSREITRQIAAEGVPHVVVAERFSDDDRVNFICCDSRDDSRRAVRHLVELGHKRIAMGIHVVQDSDHLDRRAGYLDGLREAGLDADPALIVEVPSSFEGGAAIVSRLMSRPEPPTAIFLTDPLLTFGALRRCLELGIRVPSDLSIVGFDDSDIRLHTFPACTAVCQDARMLGREAALWLSSWLENPQDRGRLREIRSTRLEINQTTGKPATSRFRIMPDGSREAVM